MKNKILWLNLLIIAVTSACWYFSPIYLPFPKLTGTYGVGVTTQQFTDLDRREIYSNHPDDKRTLIVDLYYPAAKSEQLYPYQPDKISALIQAAADHSWLPHFVWKKLLGNIKCYSQPDGLIANTNQLFPIIIALPGIGGSAPNSDLEEIASWGYVVIAIYPSYDVEGVVLANGNIIKLNPELRTYVAQNDRPKIYAYRGRAHQIWLADIQFVLQQLHTINNSDSVFKHRLDFSRVGILGISHGGGVAIDFCRDNATCKAGIDMDGWTKTANTDQGFNKPFLFLMSKDNIDKIEPLFANMGPLAQKVLIHWANHGNFGSPVLKCPLSRLAGSNRDSMEIRNDILQHVHDFFEKYL